MGFLLSRSVLKRLKELENALLDDDSEKVQDVVLFNYASGGLFGHSHIVYHFKDQKNEEFPCSVEEEIEMMKAKYEDSYHKFSAQGDELSFPDFLERFDYLGPKSLADERKAVIQKLRQEANGAT